MLELLKQLDNREHPMGSYESRSYLWYSVKDLDLTSAVSIDTRFRILERIAHQPLAAAQQLETVNCWRHAICNIRDGG